MALTVKTPPFAATPTAANVFIYPCQGTLAPQTVKFNITGPLGTKLISAQVFATPSLASAANLVGTVYLGKQLDANTLAVVDAAGTEATLQVAPATISTDGSVSAAGAAATEVVSYPSDAPWITSVTVPTTTLPTTMTLIIDPSRRTTDFDFAGLVLVGPSATRPIRLSSGKSDRLGVRRFGHLDARSTQKLIGNSISHPESPPGRLPGGSLHYRLSHPKPQLSAPVSCSLTRTHRHGKMYITARHGVEVCYAVNSPQSRSRKYPEHTPMLSKYGRGWIATPLSHIAGWLEATGISPNTLTLIGFGLTLVVALVLASGQLLWGGLLLIVAALFDTLDGAVARHAGKTSVFGAFLDSVMDRFSEAVTLIALIYYYSGQADGRLPVVLLAVALAGSLMVSYTRARAEAVNIECKEGFFQRTERIVVLIIGLVTGWMLPVLWILAILTNVTAVQRIYDVYRKTKPTNS